MRGDLSVFQKSLLAWFDGHKRQLPWRESPSLYGTVVSEFMLQQTQVDTVLPYFERWMKTFPDFASLAEAPEAAVMKQWEGLGYYSRARNLHKLAKSIVADGIPDNPDNWKKRPGIGPYTAAAISSIAQKLPEPVIDGNVIRVLSRLSNDATPVKSSAEAQKRFYPLAKQLIDASRPGDYNEAVMELGATVCHKSRPACLACPVRLHCQGAAQGTAEALPVIVRKGTTQRDVHSLWLVDKGRILLHFYPSNARRLAGIAELPILPEKPEGKPVAIKRRGISSERITESIYSLPLNHAFSKEAVALKTTRWIDLGQLEAISISGPHRRWIEELISKCDLGA